MGILVTMNVYVIRNSKLRLDKSMVTGSILAIASSACASCNRLTNYQTPLRMISIVILLWALYLVQNKITKPCAKST